MKTKTGLRPGVDPYLGEVRLFAFDYAPRGWEKAYGQIQHIDRHNEALYSLLGPMFGGDGRTTFALPKLAPVTDRAGGKLHYNVAVSGNYPTRN